MTSSFSPTQDELNLVSQVFAIADPQKIGVVTGEAAVKVFSGAKLPPTVLGEIWNVADAENNGFLSKKGVAIALRLIAWAQKGEKVTAAQVNKPGPLPTIDGLTAVVQHNTGFSSAPKSPPPMGGLPAFTPQDRAKFLRMFQGSGPVNGLLSAEKASDIFVKSKLPVEKLSQIWNLADTQERGQLDSTDFAIGMYFIQAAMSNQLPFMPTSLPPGLYDQVAGRAIATHSTGASVTPHLTGTLPHRSPVQPQYTGIQPQYTGQSQTARAPSRPNTTVLGASAFGAFSTPWDITDAEKANADRLFNNLDSLKRGFIEGDVAVPFMLESKLPGDDLARIWDLADLNNDGRLTRDGFAVAMHLIQGKLSGRDIPATLPTSLVPPSMRGISAVQPPPPKAPEPQIDLLWGDDSPPSIPASLPTLSPQPTATHTVPKQSPIPAASPPAVQSTQINDPFGTKFTPNNDFLSDDHEPTHSPQLQDKSAEIGNIQNILSSTNRSLESTKVDKAEIENQLQSQTAQLTALQTQLSSAKASYETETRLLATLRERYNTQQADIQKTREELIRAESDLSAVRVEKAEIEGSVLRDKEEARELHRKMVEAGQQADALKIEVEKVKKEAKQHKGRLAIARKQLSTKEADKAKVEKELAEAKEELSTTLKEVEETEADIAKLDAAPQPDSVGQPFRSTSADTLAFAAATALPLSPDVTGISGVSSPSKSNNPFERLGLSSPGATPSHSHFAPFANTTSVPPKESDSDPFSFSDAFGIEAETKPSQSPKPSSISVTSTPKQHNVPEIVDAPRAVSPNGMTPASSMSEMDSFTTPPSTAVPRSTTNSPAPVTVAASPPAPVVEEVKEKFPELKTDAPSAQTEVETDLSSQLKELDVDESDSSDDEDDIPLSTLKSKEPEKSNATSAAEPSSKHAVELSFDDAFGSGPVGSATEPAAAAAAAAKDAFGVPTSATASGVGAFDEALGKLGTTNTNSAPSAPFSFDTNFEDSFDFGSSFTPSLAAAPDPASAVQAVPAPAGQLATAPAPSSSFPIFGSTVPPVASAQNGTAASDFDAIFSPLNNVSLPEPIKEQGAEAPVNGAGKLSFDDAFGISGTPRAPGPATTEVESIPDPTSPKEPKSPAHDRRASPSPAPLSPPARVSSPISSSKPRLSTSSKESADKAPPTRHSKLSLRLPFGKKKAKAEPPPPPPRSQLLSPPAEENGAVDEDIEPVKQLCGMGFSREQAVTALEIHNYDVQKALNSLLGTP